MRASDRERKKLIDKLKTVKDPRERERIFWQLEGMEKDARGVARPYQEPEKPPLPLPGMPEKMRVPVKLPKGVNFLLRYAAPIFFIIFGLAFIFQAAMRAVQSKDFHSEVGQFITGGIFLIFGFAALQKARKTEQAAEKGEEADGRSPQGP